MNDSLLTFAFETLTSDASEKFIGSITIQRDIPVQTLRLKLYSFHWETQLLAEAPENRLVLLDVDWISQQQCAFARSSPAASINQINGYFPIVSPLNNGDVWTGDIAVTLAKPIPKQFTFRVLDRDGNPYTANKLKKVWLVFEYTRSFT